MEYFIFPIILIYTIPLLVVCCWIPMETIIKENEIIVNYPFRVFYKKKVFPINNIKSIGAGGGHHDIQSGFFYTFHYFKKEIDGRFKLSDETEAQFYIRSKKDVEFLFDFFESKGIKITTNIPRF